MQNEVTPLDRIAHIRQLTEQRTNDAQQAAQAQAHAKQLDDIRQTISALADYLVRWSHSTTRTEVVNPVRSVYTPDIEKVVAALTKLGGLVSANRLDLTPLQQELTGVKQALASLPAQMPKPAQQRDSIAVSNLAELDKRFTALEAAIKSLKLVAEAPNVTVDVPEPTVVVDPTDLSELRKPLQDVISAVKAIVIPETKPTDVTGLEKRLDDANTKLQKLIDKPIGGGGGGGGSLPYEGLDSTPSHATVDTDKFQLIAEGPKTTRLDVQGDIIYDAYAPVGTTDSGEGWTITKYDISDLTDASGKVATDVSWNDRATGSYA